MPWGRSGIQSLDQTQVVWGKPFFVQKLFNFIPKISANNDSFMSGWSNCVLKVFTCTKGVKGSLRGQVWGASPGPLHFKHNTLPQLN